MRGVCVIWKQLQDTLWNLKSELQKEKVGVYVCVKNNHTYKFACAWNIFVKIPKKVWTVISSGAGKTNMLFFTICPILYGLFLSCVF